MVTVVVEGDSDREAAKAVVAAAGRTVTKVHVAGGKSRLDPKIGKYNQAARRAAWVVFRDSDGECPVTLRDKLMTNLVGPSPYFSLRIAHSMTEAWLLADAEGFAEFFGVSRARIAHDPESLVHAKREVLRLCASSRLRWVKNEVVTPKGEIGPLYVSRLNEFAASRWNVEVAAENCGSLRRAIDRIRSLP